jgi:F420-dependent oxidoreductase-like protein
MIEGQNGLNWTRWQRIASTVENCGYEGLYRSDHFTNGKPPDMDSLECWVSLTWLASNTKRIKFGSLVSPMSFRHPTFTARMASAVDDLSGGRLTLGVGAGWQEREHENYGWNLLPIKERFIRFEEGLTVLSQLLKSDKPVNFTGRYFRINDGILLPRPEREGGPPILIGGNGKTRTLPLVARFAQEWNALMLPPDELSVLNAELDRLLISEGRSPKDVRRSMMTGCVFGLDAKDVERKVNKRTNGQRTADELRQKGLVVGTAKEIIEQCRQIANAGVQQVMLQWLDLDDISGLEIMADGILGQLTD